MGLLFVSFQVFLFCWDLGGFIWVSWGFLMVVLVSWLRGGEGLVGCFGLFYCEPESTDFFNLW